MEKIGKKEFLTLVARETGKTAKNIEEVYNGMISVINNNVIDGKCVSLPGFGSFYLQKHKGHAVQYAKNAALDDYVVFKFSASAALNKKFRALDEEGLVSTAK